MKFKAAIATLVGTAAVTGGLLLNSSAPTGSAQETFDAFVEFYDSELDRTGFRPDQTSTRDSRTVFLQGTVQRFCNPYVAMKRGDPGRPISDEVIVIVAPGPEYRHFGDFIVSGGTAGWSLSHHMDGYLPTAQPLVSPLMPLPQGASTPGHMTEPLPGGVVPTVAGCKPPAPEPEPEPEPPAATVPPYPGDDVFDKVGEVLFADYAAAGQAPNPGMGRWFGRTIYDWLAGNEPTLEDSIKKHRAEWRAILGLPPL